MCVEEPKDDTLEEAVLKGLQSDRMFFIERHSDPLGALKRLERQAQAYEWLKRELIEFSKARLSLSQEDVLFCLMARADQMVESSV